MRGGAGLEGSLEDIKPRVLLCCVAEGGREGVGEGVDHIVICQKGAVEERGRALGLG